MSASETLLSLGETIIANRQNPTYIMVALNYTFSTLLRYSLTGLSMLFLINSIQASEERFINELYGNAIVAGDSMIIADDKFGTTAWNDIDQTLFVKNLLVFEIDEDTFKMAQQTLTYILDLKIEVWDENASPTGAPSNVYNDSLSIQYDTTSLNSTVFRSLWQTQGAHKMTVTIVAIRTAGGTWSGQYPPMRLYGEIIVSRKYDFSCTNKPVFQTLPSGSQSDEATISWNHYDGVEEYDLEWTFYDKESKVGQAIETTTATTYTSLDWLFKNNATRVTVSAQEFTIPLIYPAGYIFLRLRAVQQKDELRENSNWTSTSVSSTTLSNFAHQIEVAWHEEDLNWQTQTSFAEEGKNVPSVSYMDGSLRQRQAVVLSNSENMTTASQTIYDHHGRPAISVLPAPTFDTTMYFDPLFAAFDATTPYNKIHFDTINNCIDSTLAMYNGKGAAKYYSPNNPQASEGYHQYIPDSKGFPFTLTEYTPDMTGRIRRQSGVGADHRLNTGHETQYFYGKPAQVELDRLFGNEVGYASHYFKNAVVDANGQISVSYLDAHGRTIATALAGTSPDSVLTLDLSQVDTATLERDLLNNEPYSESQLGSTYTFLVTNGGNYEFYYHLDTAVFKPNCLPSDVCYDCVYDVSIMITDHCGNTFNNGNPYISTKENFTLGSVVFDTLCANIPMGIIDTFTLNLPIGEYHISKILSVSQEAVDYYKDNFLTQSDCIPVYDTLLQTFQANVDLSGCGMTCETCEQGLGTEADYVNAFIQSILDIGGTVTAQDTLEAQGLYAEEVQECNSLCEGISECEIQLKLLETDVYPGAQYALFEIDTGLVTITDTTSIYYNDKFQTLYSGDVYLDEAGNPDTIFINGQSYLPTELDVLSFIEYWKPSWATPLTKRYHPEYCLYEFCISDAASNTRDSLMYEVTSYEEAIALGLIDSLGNVLNDPFFEPGGMGEGYEDIMIDYFTTVTQDGCINNSLTSMVTNAVYCGGTYPCDYTFGSGCDADNDFAWQVLNVLYQSMKYQIMGEIIDTLSHCSNECIGSIATECGGINNPYKDKLQRLPRLEGLGISPQVLINTAIAQVDADLSEHCNNVCDANVDFWMQKLSNCTTGLSTSGIDSLRTRLKLVCISGCDTSHPFGSSTTSDPDTLTVYGDHSFADIISDVVGPQSICDTLCHSDQIDFPGAYDTPVYEGAQQMFTFLSADTCLCSNLDSLEAGYLAYPDTFTTFSSFLIQFSDIELKQADIDTLMAYCDNSNCNTLPHQIIIPPYLECNTCKTCDEVVALVNIFNDSCSVSHPEYAALRTRYLNHELGFSLNEDEYQAFITTCGMSYPEAYENILVLCPESAYGAAEQEDNCVSDLLTQAAINAELAYRSILDSLGDAFVTEYLGYCIDGATETFHNTGAYNEYQFTLYYYDQAGNLAKTIPPRGVDPLTTSFELGKVKNYRNNITSTPTYPDHTYETKYVYNSLNEVIRQDSPDTDESHFWYDRVGRVVISQDGRQTPDDLYSYTLYDPLGRIIEVGEKYNTTAMTDAIARDLEDLEDWITGGTASSRTSITSTYYDDILLDLEAAFGDKGQENLRSRVSTITTESVNDDNPNTYDYASHYSYDVSGNVKTLVQEIVELHPHGQGYKRIDYDYDYISGNVNAVYYQKDSTDQMIHRYTYDENNRLLEAQTNMIESSPLSYLWERDAIYEYYLHGPLARTEIGHRRVQGIDFAYSLHGWIKGINSGALDETKDIGKDGDDQSAATQAVARDAATYTLGYYKGDYQPIGGSTAKFELAYENTVYDGAAQFSAYDGASSSLYNGNIRNMTYHNRALDAPIGKAYKYDQLHRLRRSKAFENPDFTNWTWEGGNETQHYYTTHQYDKNGNLTYVQRKNNSNSLMDLLVYHYKSGTNILTHVTDQYDIVDYDDFVTQNSGNYTYDGSGNLVKNEQDSTRINWNVYGKILDVLYTSNNRKTTYGYDPAQNRVVKARIDSVATDTTFTYYFRDAQGNVMGVYTRHQDTLTWKEQHLYGSSRLGILEPDVVWIDDDLEDVPYFAEKGILLEGWKRYEITNHLGNVLAVMNDRKTPKDTDSDGVADYYLPTILSASDYYPFGLQMPGRTQNSPDYRYGFNGKEKDEDGEMGSLTTYDYGFRIYNPGIGKFLSVDPLTKSYPWYTPYQFAGNTPIQAIDIDGLEPGYVTGAAWLAEKQNPQLAKGIYQTARNYEVYSGAGTLTGGAVYAGPVAAIYTYTNPGAANEVAATVWSFFTDENYPGGLSDDFIKVGKHAAGEVFDNLTDVGRSAGRKNLTPDLPVAEKIAAFEKASSFTKGTGGGYNWVLGNDDVVEGFIDYPTQPGVLNIHAHGIAGDPNLYYKIDGNKKLQEYPIDAVLDKIRINFPDVERINVFTCCGSTTAKALNEKLKIETVGFKTPVSADSKNLKLYTDDPKSDVTKFKKP